MLSSPLLEPGNGLGLQELVVAGDSAEAPEATALPASVGQDGLVVHGDGVDVDGTDGN